ncbi:MAG: hypothetical protein KH846_05600 [Leptotrichia wadei]|jgi:hypothetical protein|uniref:sugar nucleotide-binding protein n=1 Tax=Leptotrichia wadei TaxID=157687 RepID=UPI0026EB00EC|nr:sugar nucleotide-binding protein [Leptotrichia wadei]MBS6019659.1 hypothetical protein [Leptotrichia wadei]
MVSLVGYTGFVGSNIYSSGNFDEVYDSKNILEAYGTNPDLLIYSGLPAEKYLANNNPKKDMELILGAEKNISLINPKKLVLISTIDVFKSPINVNENTMIDTKNLHPYGYNRYLLENWVRENYKDALIVRLPALFGENIKKNFIYDLINIIPTMLKEEKFKELLILDKEIEKYYKIQDNGFYKVKNLNKIEKEILKEKFKNLNFTALNFTDSRSQYQFYPLNRLWKDINICLKNDIKLWHPATEPITSKEIYEYVVGQEFSNKLEGVPICYDYKTLFYKVFSGENGYILNKNQVLKKIKEFVLSQ